MKHITLAEKSLLVGDEAADTLVKYAALIAELGSGDTVEVNAVGIDGEAVTATFLLNSGTTLLIETTRSHLPEPDNRRVVEYMQEKLRNYGPVAPEYPGQGLAGDA